MIDLLHHFIATLALLYPGKRVASVQDYFDPQSRLPHGQGNNGTQTQSFDLKWSNSLNDPFILHLNPTGSYLPWTSGHEKMPEDTN
jgi:hypothetical protein